MSNYNSKSVNEQDTVKIADFLQKLWRGGEYAYIWRLQDKRSLWFKVDAPRPLLDFEGRDYYFGVHPLAISKKATQRATNNDIVAINCLYGDFDMKDFADMDALKSHIDTLPLPPTSLIFSGGGYHGYWILREAFALNGKDTRARAKRLQARWVELVGADKGAKDLARILRYPGSYNQKYDDKPQVRFEFLDLSRVYTIEQLEKLVQPQERKTRRRTLQANTYGHLSKATQDFIKNGATEGERNTRLFSAACDMFGNGYTQSEIETRLLGAALQSGLAEREAQRTIQSAVSEQRDPAIPRSEQAKYDESPARGQKKPELDNGFVLDCAKRADQGAGELFVELHSNGDMVFDFSETRWYMFENERWQCDNPQRIRTRVAKDLGALFHAAAGAYAGTPDSTVAHKAMQKMYRLGCQNSVLDKASEFLFTDGADWDNGAGLIGVQNGVVDLATGALLENKPAFRIRKYANVDYNPDDLQKPLAQIAPLFARAITQIFANEREVIDYVHRVLGYALSGSSSENKFFILHGSGQNGKTTLLETLRSVLGDYATPIDARLLTQETRGGATPELLCLQGARLAWCSESGRGAKLNAEMVKRLAGADELVGRPLYGNPVSWQPTHTLLFLTNHKPRVDAFDAAMWLRIVLIPFEQAFVDNPRSANEHQVDRTLAEKLLAERNGIFAWLVRGHMEYMERGLGDIPAACRVAAEEYREEQNPLHDFYATRCVIGDDCVASAAQLYATYKTWCAENGIRKPWTQTKFGLVVGEDFESKYRTHAGVRATWYSGIGIRD